MQRPHTHGSTAGNRAARLLSARALFWPAAAQKASLTRFQKVLKKTLPVAKTSYSDTFNRVLTDYDARQLDVRSPSPACRLPPAAAANAAAAAAVAACHPSPTVQRARRYAHKQARQRAETTAPLE